MEKTEAILLAGGLGTRLRSAVPDVPKCMAPVEGKPFIAYLIHHLQSEGIQKFIFALGYKSEAFEDFISSILSPLDYKLSIESEPLGTGGAIKQACSLVNGTTAIVANGDTLFRINVKKLISFHLACAAHCTLSLKPLKDFNRYGVVELNKDYTVKSFSEKRQYSKGLINGGVYALSAKKFVSEALPVKFSFEKDYLEKFYDRRRIFGLVQDEYFIDIGIPADYSRAQWELKSSIGDSQSGRHA
jgi:D-glycero-alpha-D-manno-heptose 1-phosphate guanylyltransferase